MQMRRELAAALTAALIAGNAWADHPGALWSIDHLDVRSDGASSEQVSAARVALLDANDTYFYGDVPVRMVATVSASGDVSVELVDPATGRVLMDRAALNENGLAEQALAWMEQLDCTAGVCGAPEPTQLASAPVSKAVTEPSPTTRDTASWPQTVTGVLGAEAGNLVASANTGLPMPKPRPTSTGLPDLTGLRSVVIARNPDPTVPPIRISRFDSRSLAPISYSAADRLVLREPRGLAPATQSLPQPQEAPRSRSLIGRWVDNVASFLGIAEQPPQKPEPKLAALPGNVPATRAASVYAPQGTRLRPTEQWTQNPASAPRIAALDTSPVGGRSALPAPRAAREVAQTSNIAPVRQPSTTTTLPDPGYTATGLRIVRSPGLGLPRPSAQETATPLVTPIRLARADTTASDAQNLAVRLHPEVFGKYSTAAAERLFGGYSSSSAPVRLVSAAQRGNSPQSVDRILANRGLALDSERYAKAERIFWSGRSGSRGFWIALPQVTPSSYVLIASAQASVIANVYARGSSVQVSDAVAKALGLDSGQWSDVQIIALKPIDRTASRETVTITR